MVDGKDLRLADEIRYILIVERAKLCEIKCSETLCLHVSLVRIKIAPPNQIAMEDVCLRHSRLMPRVFLAPVSLFLSGQNAQQIFQVAGSTIPAAELAVLQGMGQSFIRCLMAVHLRDVASGQLIRSPVKLLNHKMFVAGLRRITKQSFGVGRPRGTEFTDFLSTTTTNQTILAH